MPYADVEKRRQFQREYKRKWRAKQAKIQPLLGFKVYLCVRFPGLHVPGATSFVNGFLVTDDPTVQAQVEAHDLFEKHIFPLALDLSCTPTEDE
jgi:hypothetical protein